MFKGSKQHQTVRKNNNLCCSFQQWHPFQIPMLMMNCCGLILPTQTQTSEQEYNILKASNMQVSTQYFGNTSTALIKILCLWPDLMLFRVQQNKHSHVYHMPKILLESESLVSISTVRIKAALDIPQLWFNYFVVLFKALGMLRRKMPW